jgi:drug/metabolite transporter (DMT)-like permease
MTARYGVRVWLALATVYIVWGSTFIALAIVIRDLPPFLAMSARHLIAGGGCSRSRFPRRSGGRPDRPAPDRGGVRLRRAPLRDRPRVARVGAADGAGGVAALLVGTIPIWMALFDRVGFGKRLPRTAYAGIASASRARVPVRPVREGLGRPASARS